MATKISVSHETKELHKNINAPFDILLYRPEEYAKGIRGLLPELTEQEGKK
ncbi:MAG: hypothetical protein ACMXYD_02715 [Candidatus Woesearchaeota archaeon]